MSPLFYILGFLFCFAVAIAGRTMHLRPELGGKLFFWAPVFATAYFRFTGVFFFVFGFVGMFFYAVLTVFAFLPLAPR